MLTYRGRRIPETLEEIVDRERTVVIVHDMQNDNNGANGAYEEVETDLGDYEKAAGVFVATSIESGRKGAPDKQRVIIDKVEANGPVDDKIFHFPTASK